MTNPISSMMLPVEEIATVFHDLEPVVQDDGPQPVCAIQYPVPFVTAYDMIRAVWKAGEFSDRALKLSATCLKLNPANYTVWHFRRQCLQNIHTTATSTTASDVGMDDDTGSNNGNGGSGDGGPYHIGPEIIQADLRLASSLGGDNPKNYQIWYHRRALLETSDNTILKNDFLQSELEYIAQVLEEDSKNYHAWSHRQWLLKKVNDDSTWIQELDYVHTLIQNDPRNNSAWNQRWFVVHRGGIHPNNKALSLESCRQEAHYAIDSGASIDPYNESPFRYLIGLLREQQQPQQPHNLEQLVTDFYEKTETVIRAILIEANRNPDSCANWTSARIDLLEMMGDTTSLEHAIELANGLSNEHDLIRKKYWLWRVQQLTHKKGSML